MKNRRAHPRENLFQRCTRNRAAAVCIPVMLFVVVAVLAVGSARWSTARSAPAAGTATVSDTLQTPGAGSLSADSPSTEFIYVGGRLLATEQQEQTCIQRFSDVPPSHPYFQDVCILQRRGIALGCTTTTYCPDAAVTRAQMATFIERALGVLNPPTPATQRFNDVPPSHFAYAFIDDLARRQITLGCSATPPLFCPEESVSHEQMAAFMERAVGVFQPPTPSQQTFCDVPPNNAFYAFIEDYFSRGVWPGCVGVGTGAACGGIAGCTPSSRCFCPGRVVTRAEMARILVRNFNLS